MRQLELVILVKSTVSPIVLAMHVRRPKRVSVSNILLFHLQGFVLVPCVYVTWRASQL